MFATSVKAMVAELERAEALDLPFIVMHPGSHGGAGEEAGLERIVKGLNEIETKTKGFRCRMALSDRRPRERFGLPARTFEGSIGTG